MRECTVPIALSKVALTEIEGQTDYRKALQQLACCQVTNEPAVSGQKVVV